MCLAALLVGGNTGLTVFHDYVWTLHYLPALLFLPLFGLPMLAGWTLSGRLAPAARWWGSMVLAAGVAVASGVALTRTPIPRREITAYRTPLGAMLDEIAPRYGLRYCLASYWEARMVTLLSRERLRVYAVDSALNPFLWECNAAWYAESLEDLHKPPPVDFVVLGDAALPIDRNTVFARYGEPYREIQLGTMDVMILRWPDGAATGDVNERLTDFRQEITSRAGRVRARAGETIELPVTVRNTGSARWASEGRFPVRLSYHWIGAGVNGEGDRTPLPGVIGPGQEVKLAVKVTIPATPGKDLTLRFSLLQEHVAWFTEHGAAPCDVQVSVR